MTDKQEILSHLKKVLEELFEIDPADVSEDANLYEDLDIDSIDAVDLIVHLKEYTGRKIQPAEFKDARTVGDVVNAVQDLMDNEPEPEQ